MKEEIENFDYSIEKTNEGNVRFIIGDKPTSKSWIIHEYYASNLGDLLGYVSIAIKIDEVISVLEKYLTSTEIIDDDELTTIYEGSLLLLDMRMILVSVRELADHGQVLLEGDYKVFKASCIHSAARAAIPTLQIKDGRDLKGGKDLMDILKGWESIMVNIYDHDPDIGYNQVIDLDKINPILNMFKAYFSELMDVVSECDDHSG